ncbi:family 43 glycosylhydrolase, partial [Streptomyces sp. MCAF7]
MIHAKSARTRPGGRVRRGRRLAVLAAATAFALLPTSASAYPNPGRVTGDIVVHDPTMIRASDGSYLLYSTHGGLEARTSTDRIAFSRSGNAFNTPPSWWKNYSSSNDPWAPDISYQGGKYLMYYAVSSFGSSNSAIGFATSSSGKAGTWTDYGIVHSTTGS